MRALHSVVGVLLAGLAVVAGLWLVWHGLGGRDALRGAAEVASPLAVIGWGLVLAVLGLGYAATGWLQRRGKLLTFENESGTVNIRSDAICDFVAKLAPEFPAVTRLVPVVKVRRGAIDVVIAARVQDGANVQETCELLQQRVRERLVTGLGITQVRRVEVNVTDVAEASQDA